MATHLIQPAPPVRPGDTTPRQEIRQPPPKRPSPRRDPHRFHPNLGPLERWIDTLGGVALGVYGLRRGSAGGAAMAGLGAALATRGATGYCPLYQALGIDQAHPQPDASAYFHRGIQVIHAVTINRTRGELYSFWRHLENLPRFMRNLQSVRDLGDARSRWRAHGPAGSVVQWDAQIIHDDPGTLLAWQSLPDADVDTAGSVRFLDAPGNRGTEVHVNLQYIPPAGKIGSAFAWLFGKNPSQQIREDLRRFKQLMETGEIPTTQGQPRGVAC